MALTIGELVGFIQADDSGFQQGLSDAQLAMRGLQRDADGRLRNLRGRFISEGEAAGMGLADGIRAHAEAAAPAVRKLGLALGAIGVAVPGIAAAATALGGVAAGAVAAGLAVKAFQLAAKPQLEAVTEASQAAEKAEAAHEVAARKKAAAQKLAAKGGDDYKRALRESESAARAAADADAALKQQMDGLPPATRETAKAMAGLKTDYQAWSDSLSGTTMPVFTEGIQILRDLLPTLTPFVKAAATALGGFLDEVAAGVKSAGFKRWADDMANAAGPALSNFLTVIKNLAVGFGGLLQAFLPVSDTMTGGLASATDAFAEWATTLGDSQGFAVFMDLAREGGETFKVLATAALEVLAALSPLVGVTAQLAIWLADIINSIPPEHLKAIATAWAAIALGVKAYALYTAIAAGATRAWAIAQGLWNTIMMMNPIGLVIGLIVGLIAIIVVAYRESETFREIVQDVWDAIKTAIVTAVGWILESIESFSKIPGLMAAWFGLAKDWAIEKFMQLIVWLAGVPDRAWKALAGLGGMLQRRAAEAGIALVTAIRQQLTNAVNWVKGLPERARSAMGGLGNVLWNAGRSLISGFINGLVSKFGDVQSTLGGLTSSLTSWKGPETLDKRILTPAGRMVIAGFQRGIDEQTPALRAQLQGLTGAVPGMALGGLGAASGGGGGGGVLRVELSGPEEMTRLIRGIVWVKGGGDVQLALGGRRF